MPLNSPIFTSKIISFLQSTLSLEFFSRYSIDTFSIFVHPRSDVIYFPKLLLSPIEAASCSPCRLSTVADSDRCKLQISTQVASHGSAIFFWPILILQFPMQTTIHVTTPDASTPRGTITRRHAVGRHRCSSVFSSLNTYCARGPIHTETIPWKRL